MNQLPVSRIQPRQANRAVSEHDEVEDDEPRDECDAVGDQIKTLRKGMKGDPVQPERSASR
jgi:hypothetical protein